MNSTVRVPLIATLLCLATVSSHAAVLSGPNGQIASVTQTSGDALIVWSGPITNLINDATTTGYTQVGGFQGPEDVAWIDDTPNATIVLTLNQNYDLSQLYVWGYQTNWSVTTMSIAFSPDLSSPFTGSTAINHTNYINGVTPYALSASNVRRVQLTATSSAGGIGSAACLSEIAFEGVIVPEPSSMLLGSLGILALLRRRRA